MSDKIFFTPGPSGLYPTVAKHIQQALADDVCSISHRSKKYEAIHSHTVESLKALLQIPAENHIFFSGSATETWDRVIENLTENSSYHLVNGSFSKRFYETSKELLRDAQKLEVDFGKGFDVADAKVPANTEVLCFTHNETSSGVMMPLADMYKLRDQHADKLVAVDAVSSMPYPVFDYKKIDTALFSVQKGFGMPAGLGAWIVNEKCVERAKEIQAKGKSIGTYHNIPSLLSKSVTNQTPETPNVLGIYVLGKVAEDMLKYGPEKLRKETEEKAQKLYAFAEKSSTFDIFVENPAHRSQTVIVLNTKVTPAEVNKQLEPFGMSVGSGYGKGNKDTQVRIASFPAHSPEQVDRLIDKLKTI